MMCFKREICEGKPARGKLLENTVMLYLMKFAGYLFSLITVPYQTRVLSTGSYGALSLAVSMMLYFQLIIDFGFMVSGVGEVSANREEPRKLSEILTSVMIIRLVLIGCSAAGLEILLACFENYGRWAAVFHTYFLAVSLEALLPTFFLRGVEDMKTVTVLTLISKACTTVLIFLLVKDNKDYLIVPWLRVAGAVLSFFIAWVYIGRKYHVGLTRVPLKDIWTRMKEAFGYFTSRIASSVYRGSNAAVLGLLYPTSTVAVYSAAEKIAGLAMTLCSPISDSLLPHTVKTKDYQAAWLLIKIAAPFILAGGIIGFVFAGPIVVFLFGAAYADSAAVLRAMIPIIAVTLPNYILAFPVLVPMGLGKQSNYANLVGAGFYMAGLLLLWIVHAITILSVALLVSATEFLVMLWRVLIVVKYRDRLTAHQYLKGVW